MDIFNISKRFPVEEHYALTGQIRRSSRSVCLNLQEAEKKAWAKRRYEAHIINKLTDCDGEINETITSLDFAKDCSYITEEEYEKLITSCKEIGKILGAIIRNPSKFLTC